ncbi:MAG TPA: L,D-transpeptidase [Solirubrobacteraceae bacterium]|nr:L,D-transpeptidase [Solirubrobacteraceae bacterium]
MRVRRRRAAGLSVAIAVLIGAGASGQALAATTHPPALRLVAVSPKGAIPGDATIELRFSAPLAPLSARSEPKVSPVTSGAWSQPNPTTLAFTPTSGWLPGTVVSIAVPKGLAAADGAALRRAVAVTSTVETGSTVRLAQLLAELRFLPVHLRSSAGQPRPGDAAGQVRAIFRPPPGKLDLGSEWPAQLRDLWAHDPPVVLRGAVMAFESQHGLPMDGVASTLLWRALLAARFHRQFNAAGYNYALATESSPETLTLYHNGRVVLRSDANTGIGGRGTAPGTFPVYQRLRSQTMQGTNPDGSHYADYVQWVAYFNGGDAVHYIPRASYGSPQSLGCIELPYAAAEQAWGYLTYGTLVTVL